MVTAAEARTTASTAESGALGAPHRRVAGAGALLVGTQGWSYDQWDGLVYSAGRPKGERLARYSRLFPLVEIDNTYYATPRAILVQRWAEQTPPGFVFTAKVPKQVTQEARLQGDEALRQLAVFLETMRLLGDRLGPLVFQMSPGFRASRDVDALATMLRRLPELGGEGLRFAVEFRHSSWLASGEPEALLRAHGVAWVWNDWEPTEPYLAPMPRAIDDAGAGKVTANDFAYLRLTGNHDADIDYRTTTINRGADLARWAKRVLRFRREREGRDVYVLLNNHYAGSSAKTVQELQRHLGLPVVTFGAVDERPRPLALF